MWHWIRTSTWKDELRHLRRTVRTHRHIISKMAWTQKITNDKVARKKKKTITQRRKQNRFFELRSLVFLLFLSFILSFSLSFFFFPLVTFSLSFSVSNKKYMLKAPPPHPFNINKILNISQRENTGRHPFLSLPREGTPPAIPTLQTLRFSVFLIVIVYRTK